jgi:hypothetical protein
VSVFWRSWATVCVLVAIVVTILGGLVTLQYEATLSQLIQGRLAVLAQTSHGSFSAALSLGLPLPAVRNAPAILERVRQTDPDILAVHVFAPDGRILHSTDPGHLTSVRSEVLFASSAADGESFHVETAEFLLSGALLADSASHFVGGLVIVYPRAELAIPVRAMMARLAVFAAAVLMMVGLLAGVVLRFGLREHVRVYDGLELAFAALERRAWRRAAGGSDPLPEPVRGLGIDTGELTRMLQEADARYVTAGSELAALETGSDPGGVHDLERNR